MVAWNGGGVILHKRQANGIEQGPPRKRGLDAHSAWEAERVWAGWGMQYPGRQQGEAILSLDLAGGQGSRKDVGPSPALLVHLVAQTASVAVPCLSALRAESSTDLPQLLCAYKDSVKD